MFFCSSKLRFIADDNGRTGRLASKQFRVWTHVTHVRWTSIIITMLMSLIDCDFYDWQSRMINEWMEWIELPTIAAMTFLICALCTAEGQRSVFPMEHSISFSILGVRDRRLMRSIGWGSHCMEEEERRVSNNFQRVLECFERTRILDVNIADRCWCGNVASVQRDRCDETQQKWRRPLLYNFSFINYEITTLKWRSTMNVIRPSQLMRKMNEEKKRKNKQQKHKMNLIKLGSAVSFARSTVWRRSTERCEWVCECVWVAS